MAELYEMPSENPQVLQHASVIRPTDSKVHLLVRESVSAYTLHVFTSPWLSGFL
jgi:hypothetical protein